MSDHPQDGGQNASATPLASSRLVPVSTQGSYDPFEIIPMITELYEMYAKMRYIPASNIKYPPHSPPVDVEKARSLGFEPQVIELLERLPYVQGTDSEFEFFRGGGFLDNRGDHDFEHYLHDPFYADPEGGFDDENGLYVRPWVLPLNDMGNHGSVMFFDTRTGHITCAWQLGGTSDPEMWGKYMQQPESEAKNRNSLDDLPSRPARKLFRDIMLRLHTLEWIPFGSRIKETDEDSKDKIDKEHQQLEFMFRYYGWPDNFDAAGFDKAKNRYMEFERVTWEAEKVEGDVKVASDHVRSFSYQYNEMLKRYKGGIWDGDPNKPAEEVEKLEAELKNKQEIVERCKNTLEAKTKRYDEREGPEAEIARAWQKHLQGHIEWLERNIEFRLKQGDRLNDADKDELQKEQDKLAILLEQVRDTSMLPKTAEEAIKGSGGTIGMDWY